MPEQPNPAGDGGAPAPQGGATPPAGEQPAAGAEPKGKAPKGGEPKPAGDGDQGQEEPQARKTPRDYYLERQKRREAKAKAEPEGGKPKEGAEAGEEISPDDEEIVEKVVDKKFGPHIEKIEAAELKAEVDTFISDNPDYKPYRAKIERWAKHPAYSSLPIDRVAYAAIGPELLKIGADRARKADEEARKSGTGGGTGRTPAPGKSVKDMTSEEFQAHKAKVLQESRKD